MLDDNEKIYCYTVLDVCFDQDWIGSVKSFKTYKEAMTWLLSTDYKFKGSPFVVGVPEVG